MPLRTPALLAAVLLLAPAAARATPLEVRTAVTEGTRSSRAADWALRPLPSGPVSPGAYRLIEHWVAEVALPPPDGTPRLLVLPVRGGLGLVWARRW